MCHVALGRDCTLLGHQRRIWAAGPQDPCTDHLLGNQHVSGILMNIITSKAQLNSSPSCIFLGVDSTGTPLNSDCYSQGPNHHKDEVRIQSDHYQSQKKSNGRIVLCLLPQCLGSIFSCYFFYYLLPHITKIFMLKERLTRECCFYCL